MGDIIEAKGKKILTQVTANNSLEGKFPGPENSVNVNEEILENFNKELNGKIQTNISQLKNYCKAEEYHQKYLEKNR